MPAAALRAAAGLLCLFGEVVDAMLVITADGLVRVFVPAKPPRPPVLHVVSADPEPANERSANP